MLLLPFPFPLKVLPFPETTVVCPLITLFPPSSSLYPLSSPVFHFPLPLPCPTKPLSRGTNMSRQSPNLFVFISFHTSLIDTKSAQSTRRPWLPCCSHVSVRPSVLRIENRPSGPALPCPIHYPNPSADAAERLAFGLAANL